MKILYEWIIVACLIVLTLMVGIMSKDDNDSEQKYYCQMVHEGVQPDYNETYKQGKCPKGE